MRDRLKARLEDLAVLYFITLFYAVVVYCGGAEASVKKMLGSRRSFRQPVKNSMKRFNLLRKVVLGRP